MRGPGPAAPRRAREASGGWAWKEASVRSARSRAPYPALQEAASTEGREREGGPDQELGEP